MANYDPNRDYSAEIAKTTDANLKKQLLSERQNKIDAMKQNNTYNNNWASNDVVSGWNSGGNNSGAYGSSSYGQGEINNAYNNIVQNMPKNNGINNTVNTNPNAPPSINYLPNNPNNSVNISQFGNSSQAKSGYQAQGNYNDSYFNQNNSDIYNQILQEKKNYDEAKKRGDKVGMEAAHQKAEYLRKYNGGYSGGEDGSGYIKDPIKDYYDPFAYDSLLKEQEDVIKKKTELGLMELEGERGGINQNYDAVSKQAYIDYMQNKKNLGQQMASMGLTGGASESAALRTNNAYSTVRGEGETARANAISGLDKDIAKFKATGELSIAENAARHKQSAMEAYQSALDKMREQSNWEKMYGLQSNELQMQKDQNVWNNAYQLNQAGFSNEYIAKILKIDVGQVPYAIEADKRDSAWKQKMDTKNFNLASSRSSGGGGGGGYTNRIGSGGGGGYTSRIGSGGKKYEATIDVSDLQAVKNAEAYMKNDKISSSPSAILSDLKNHHLTPEELISAAVHLNISEAEYNNWKANQ